MIQHSIFVINKWLIYKGKVYRKEGKAFIDVIKSGFPKNCVAFDWRPDTYYILKRVS